MDTPRVQTRGLNARYDHKTLVRTNGTGLIVLPDLLLSGPRGGAKIVDEKSHEQARCDDGQSRPQSNGADDVANIKIDEGFERKYGDNVGDCDDRRDRCQAGACRPTSIFLLIGKARGVFFGRSKFGACQFSRKLSLRRTHG